MTTAALLELPAVMETGLTACALTLRVTDAETFERAAGILKDLAAERKEIISQTEDVISQAYALHKKLKADQNVLVKPIEDAERYLRGELGAYEQEQIRLRREAERAAESERRKAEEEARLIAAADAEKNGNAALSDAILESMFTPVEVSAARISVPVSVSEKPKAQGIAFTTVYDVNVTDKLAFIRWVASKPEFMHFLDVNEQSIKQFAKSTQGAIQPAGLKISTRQVARTTGR